MFQHLFIILVIGEMKVIGFSMGQVVMMERRLLTMDNRYAASASA